MELNFEKNPRRFIMIDKEKIALFLLYNEKPSPPLRPYDPDRPARTPVIIPTSDMRVEILPNPAGLGLDEKIVERCTG